MDAGLYPPPTPNQGTHGWGGGWDTHEQQQTLVLPDGPAAAQEAEQKKQAPHGQEDVGARDEQGIGGHDLPEAGGVHHDPDANAQQAGSAQLFPGARQERREDTGRNHG